MQTQQNKLRLRKGGALISALFITAIAAMIATALAVQQRLIIQESDLVAHADADYLSCLNMQAAAKTSVLRYAVQWQNPQSAPTSLIPLQTTLPTMQVGNMVLSGYLDDEQGKFNLNDLSYFVNQSRFVMLLQSVYPAIATPQAYAIAKAITAWITNGAQDRYYMSLHPPYRSSKAQLANISELRLIVGVTPEIYAALQPYITALPITPPPINTGTGPAASAPAAQAALQSTPININTATPPVLLTTNPSMTIEQAKNLVACRLRFGGFPNTQTFISDCATPMNLSSLNSITVHSRYFLAHIVGATRSRSIQSDSLIVTHTRKNNTLEILTVWQSFV